MENEEKTLMIVGAGAAGLMCAVAAGRALAAQGSARALRVVLVDADERIGRSILATGNGRCNFSNAHVAPDLYRNDAFVGKALRYLRAAAARGDFDDVLGCGYGADDEAAGLALDPVLAVFRQLGLAWRQESEGRLYPFSNKATTVLDVLRAEVERLGVRVMGGVEVRAVDEPQRQEGCFNLRCKDGRVLHANAVVVAVGGRFGAPKLPDALATMPLEPVLGPLRTRENVVKQLDNIRVRAAVSVVAPHGQVRAREEGELLFRKYGVSGIAVFNLSRFAQPGDTLLIDLLPFVEEAACSDYLLARAKRLRATRDALSNGEFFCGLLLEPVARAVMKQAGVRAEDVLDDAAMPRLERALKAFPLTVEGIGDERQCQVHRGGLDVRGFDPHTMGAREVPGLYAVGEALDVDAPCGGYNLHWAWSSAMLAAAAAFSRTRSCRASEGLRTQVSPRGLPSVARASASTSTSGTREGLADFGGPVGGEAALSSGAAPCGSKPSSRAEARFVGLSPQSAAPDEASRADSLGGER